ncbi:uncharacterized protein LOC113910880 isoform X2 [Zalophus californianus]|uniref:Uncharacterized protein LOC113910880 isoform X2 n=1 Tax=Zalophus californianus TaxID=9704 RepID=A0A6P9F1Z6_ZALCA|nr:uncharacterized protein LOC113910880 isoform X2 [Zalophus californianus]XP_035579834.1 uncharacterized protein LOC113910880 isoform X2 [Zalophus californianus]
MSGHTVLQHFPKYNVEGQMSARQLEGRKLWSPPQPRRRLPPKKREESASPSKTRSSISRTPWKILRSARPTTFPGTGQRKGPHLSLMWMRRETKTEEATGNGPTSPDGLMDDLSLESEEAKGPVFTKVVALLEPDSDSLDSTCNLSLDSMDGEGPFFTKVALLKSKTDSLETVLEDLPVDSVEGEAPSVPKVVALLEPDSDILETVLEDLPVDSVEGEAPSVPRVVALLEPDSEAPQ